MEKGITDPSGLRRPWQRGEFNHCVRKENDREAGTKTDSEDQKKAG